MKKPRSHRLARLLFPKALAYEYERGKADPVWETKRQTIIRLMAVADQLYSISSSEYKGERFYTVTLPEPETGDTQCKR